MELEYNFIGGKKKNGFKFVNLGKSTIGYGKTKVKKQNCSEIELEIAELIMNNPNKNLVKIYSVDIKKKRNSYGKI